MHNYKITLDIKTNLNSKKVKLIDDFDFALLSFIPSRNKTHSLATILIKKGISKYYDTRGDQWEYRFRYLGDTNELEDHTATGFFEISAIYFKAL